MDIAKLLAYSLTMASIYGVGIAVMTISLNISTLRKPSSMVKLMLYFTVLYGAALLVPFALLYALVRSLFPAYGEGLFMLAVSSALALNIAVHRKFYRVLWAAYERNLTGVYALALVAASALVLAAPGGTGSYMAIGQAAMLAASAAAVFVLYLRSRAAGHRQAGEPGVETVVEAKKVGGKAVWLGLDSATWDVMRPMVDQGKLPNLGALVREGASANLKTFVPTHSPIIWTSKVTGKRPLKHGIRDFLVYRFKGIDAPIELLPKDPVLSKAVKKLAGMGLVKRRPVSSRDRKCLSAWNILSDAGYKVGVVSWFVTDPVELINGTMLPEFFYMIGNREKESCAGVHPDSHKDAFCKIWNEVRGRLYSEAGAEEVRRRFNVTRPLRGIENLKFQILKDFYFQDVLRREITHYVCRNFDLDVLMVYFHGLDAVQHHFWKRQGREGDVFKDVVANYYVFVDEVFGGLRAMLPGENLFIVSSDHGHGPIKWYQKLLNIEKMRVGLEGSHARGDDGIFVASGRGVRRGVAFRDASLFSITPTFLTLMGLPVGRDMDGEPIRDILSDDAPPVSFIDTYEGRTKIVSGRPADMEEDEALLQRLRDLGYIE